MPVHFRQARVDEAENLSELAITSKAHWGYDRELLDLWRSDLRVTPETIREQIVQTIRIADECVGFFVIRPGSPGHLEHLWLLPREIGKGTGAAAFREIGRICRRSGITELTIVSDPNAEGFYLHQGARRIGEAESVPRNRMLPKLSFRIDAETSGSGPPADPDLDESDRTQV